MSDHITTLTDAIHVGLSHLTLKSGSLGLRDYAEAAARVADEHLLMVCQREAENIQRADAKMEAAASRIAELEAALPRAYEMGRDDAAQVAQERWVFRSNQWQSLINQDYPGVAIDKKTTSTRAKEADSLRNEIRALTPPADLAERIKGGGL